MMVTRTSGSWSCSWSWRNSALRNGVLMALRFSGRLSVIRRTCSDGVSTRSSGWSGAGSMGAPGSVGPGSAGIGGGDVARAGEVGDELDRLVLLGAQDHPRLAGPREACVPQPPDARGRAEEGRLLEVLVGHGGHGVLLPAGQPQLLDARRVVGEAPPGHGVAVEVVARAAHAAHVHRGERLHAVEHAADV